VHECLNAKLDSLPAIIEKFCEPQVAIVSLTITEKGYCIDPASGLLDLKQPRIVHDLDNPTLPQSVPGILVEALARRRERHLPPFTVLSCDNIPDNGHVVKNAVLGMAQKRCPELAQWIAERVSFPGTMVDRIVPAATDESLAEISAALGVEDPCAISCEPFIQWVVEDNFVAGRPAWETVGVQMTDNVLPWEQMKLRMLNGSHSFLAWLGYLAGNAHISDCMQDEVLRAAARRLMLDEQAPTLSIEGVDLTGYADGLLERFSNPALKHRTWQIAMDGSQKLPQRMLDGIRVHLARGSRWPLLALGVAGWMRYVSGVDDAGQPIDVRDPLAEKIHALVAGSNEQERVSALLSLEEIFGNDLPHSAEFVANVTSAWRQLSSLGAREAIAAALDS
jgi:fructuronate reductase